MTAVLLSVHVLAAIVAVGPVCVAGSMFPPEARRALGGDTGAAARLPVLARICRTYAVVGLAVPMSGLATALVMGVLGQPWVHVSIALTLAAALVLALVVLPRQRTLLEVAVGTRDPGTATRLTGRLATATGMFNLLWAAVTVLMILRPGSTTGV